MFAFFKEKNYCSVIELIHYAGIFFRLGVRKGKMLEPRAQAQFSHSDDNKREFQNIFCRSLVFFLYTTVHRDPTKLKTAKFQVCMPNSTFVEPF